MPTILESELESYLCEGDNLSQIGFEIGPTSRLFRQLDIGTGYGRADIVFLEWCEYDGDSELRVVVVELKKDQVNTETLNQASGYCKGICEFFQKFYPKIKVKPEICLVGGSIDLVGNFVYTAALIEGLTIYTYNLSLESGVEFDYIATRNYRKTQNVFSSAMSDAAKWVSVFSGEESQEHG